jgi:hypothetical protein
MTKMDLQILLVLTIIRQIKHLYNKNRTELTTTSILLMLFQSSGRFSVFPNIFKISTPFYGKLANLNIIRILVYLEINTPKTITNFKINEFLCNIFGCFVKTKLLQYYGSCFNKSYLPNNLTSK